MKPVRLRSLAEADLVERTQYYRAEAGSDVAERFFDAAVAALDVVASRPEGGSLRIGELCEIDGLRTREVSGFPCAWCYFVREDHVDAIRLVSYAQDLPSELADSD